MAHSRYDCNAGCPVEGTLQVIGGKWKGVILYHLLQRTHRFGELKKIMKGITQHTLTKQLRELEDHGIVSRKVFAEVPPRVEYSLTKRGESLREIILLMGEWGQANLNFIQ